MGLVSTWLDGIGLRSVVPTFEAAGIVSPSHLADLDVTYFESLGVTDPDDRRKLFYLVQRIKLAVNKKEESVEEKVDALISKDLLSEEKQEKAVQPLRRSKRIKAHVKKKKKEPKHDDNDDDRSKENNHEADLSKSPQKKKKSSSRKKKTTDGKSPPSSPSKKKTSSKKSSSKDKKSEETKKSKRKELKILPPSSNLPPIDSASEKEIETEIESVPTVDVSEDGKRAPRDSEMDSTTKDRKTASTQHRPQSKLPGSSRIGKYSKTTSSSLKSKSLDSSEDADATNLTESKDLRNKAKRRATLAPNLGSLESTYNPSASKEFDDSNVEVELNQHARKPRTRPGMDRSTKSMGVSDSALLKQYQQSQQQRSMISSSASNSKQAGRSGSTATSKGPSLVKQVSKGRSESWATKIEYLRADNEAEHELFREQVEDEAEYQDYYDMKIKVIVRKRPLNKSESKTGGTDIIQPLDYGSYGRTLVYQPKTRVDLTKEVETVPFSFDNVFDESSTNIGIYQRSLRNLVQPFFDGQWATVFAYGQTGSGKTYTMMGSNITGINAGTATNDEANLGLYYLAALDIFRMIELPEYQHLNVHISLFEIYGGKLFDLLNERKQVKCLENNEGKVCFPGLTEHAVHAPEHVMQLIEEGSENRSTGTTSRNADSSRSHAVLQIKLMKASGRRQNIEHGRYTFIDLAGSERGSDTTNACKTTRLEGAEINTSLLALKEVIRALAIGGSMTRIPFRGSKLTQVLKDSFVGKNSRCCMVACISPDIGSCEQTLNTLRYADRVKERNPETGVLPSSCQEPIKMQRMQSLQVETVTQSFTPSLDEQVHADLVLEEDNESNYHDAHEGSRQDTPSNSMSQSAVSTVKQRAGRALIASHRSIMSKWLTMVKDEMQLVNEVDNDREALGEYLQELQRLQLVQTGFLSELRCSLQNYVSAAEGSDDPGGMDDDSFEDLRD